MIKKALPFILMTLIPSVLLAYSVHVTGVVYDNGNTGVSGVDVMVRSALDDPFQYENTVTTDDGGNFSLEIEIPDDIEKGTLFFSIVDCDHASSRKRVVYNKQHNQHAVRLKSCQDKDKCKVEIGYKTDDSGRIYLVAESRGHEPFKYEWSNGETTQEITLGDAEEYCVTITAADGCQARDCVKIGKDCKTKIHVNHLNATADGYHLEARTNGLAPFKYEWSSGETTAEIRVTEPGEYCVTVVDALGCESKDCVKVPRRDCRTVIQPIRVNAQADPFGITLIARTHGKPPYTYKWNTGQETQRIFISEPGNYCVTVVDARGCESDACFEYDPRKDCKTEIAVMPRISDQTDLSIELMARTHGRPPFEYKWSTGEATKSIKVTELTEYSVEVTDANGCVSEDKIDLSMIKDRCSVKIKRSASGNLIAQPKGFPPFTYEWSTGETTKVIRPEEPGEYCVKVINGFGCEAKACIRIDDAPRHCRVKIKRSNLNDRKAVELTAQIPDHISADIEVTYLWNTEETTRSIVVEESGTYWVKVRYGDCEAFDEVKVRIGESIALSHGANDEFGQRHGEKDGVVSLSASPNPSVNQLRLQWNTADAADSVRIIVSNSSGRQVMNQKIHSDMGLNEQVIDISHLDPGIYIVNLVGKTFRSNVKVIKTH